jgi:hypothetical protein
MVDGADRSALWLATRISGLAAAGIAGDVAGLGDALTGINRADTANVESDFD